MARRISVSANEPNVNGHVAPPSDAAEPAVVAQADLTFDPAALEAPAAPPMPARGDMFDPRFLGLTQDFAAEAKVAKKWDIIKVEKPSKSRVFRVHPTWELKTFLLVLKEDSETYLVLPGLRQDLADEGTCATYALLPCVTKQGTPFIWPIATAGPDGKWNIWHQSAWEIAQKAKDRWARMQANRDAGHYVATYDVRSLDQQQEPDWPDMEFRDWLELAFRGHTIDALDHPVLRRLRLED